jgi:hypothetical protein
MYGFNSISINEVNTFQWSELTEKNPSLCILYHYTNVHLYSYCSPL